MKKWLKRLREDERGLTLVELLAVVVVLAIVGIIAFVAIGNVIENSKKDAHVANAQQLISAAKLWEATNGDIPTDGLVTGTEDFNQIEKLTNPWNSEDENYIGTVKKVGDEYQVTITGTDVKLVINEATESQINGGRKSFSEPSGD